MSNGTPALVHLVGAKIPHQVHQYEAPATDGSAHARGERIAYGAAAAEALGVPASQMFKSLVVALEHASGASGVLGAPDVQRVLDVRQEKYGIVLVAVDREASLKRVARAFGARRAELLDPAEVT
ncbi:MAG: Cys-tRNA(Pro) deacylase, partial [Chloroflexota bacterium]